MTPVSERRCECGHAVGDHDYANIKACDKCDCVAFEPEERRERQRRVRHDALAHHARIMAEVPPMPGARMWKERRGGEAPAEETPMRPSTVEGRGSAERAPYDRERHHTVPAHGGRAT